MSRCFFLKPSKTQDFGARCFGDSRGCPLWFGKSYERVIPVSPPKKNAELPHCLSIFKLRSKTSVPWSKSLLWIEAFVGQIDVVFIVFFAEKKRRFIVSSTEICCQKDNSDVVPKGCRESHRTAHWGPMSFFQKLFCHFELHMDLKYCIITL